MLPLITELRSRLSTVMAVGQVSGADRVRANQEMTNLERDVQNLPARITQEFLVPGGFDSFSQAPLFMAGTLNELNRIVGWSGNSRLDGLLKSDTLRNNIALKMMTTSNGKELGQ